MNRVVSPTARSPAMQEIESIVEEIRSGFTLNLDQFLKLVDVHADRLSKEKSAKLETLRPLLADADTPPGVLTAAQLAVLRRSHNHDQLGKVRHFLRLGRAALEKNDDLPLVWAGRWFSGIFSARNRHFFLS